MTDWVRRDCREVDPDGRVWRHAGLRVVDLPAGHEQAVDTGDVETLVLPLSGGVTVSCGDERVDLGGRANVFAGPSDFCYLPPGAPATISPTASLAPLDCDATWGAAGAVRVALAFTHAGPGLPFRHAKAADVPVEARGAGVCSRLVRDVASADGFACQRLLVVEVVTPGGNWSSFPPHKHDESRLDETELEEIYYFEVARGGVAYQRVYSTDPGRPIDVLAEVRTGDAVLVPYGWHGPSIATPGYDLWYLNVMAGPGPERAWRIRDDPAYAWIRDTWADQPFDPRLPAERQGPAEGSSR